MTQPASLATALEGVDVCFHLAGIRRATRRDEFMAVNADGTRHVAEAMVARGSRRLVLCGSLAASGPGSVARPRVESDPFAPEEWYGESKAEAERIAFSFSGKLEVTSIRPCRILGPRDRENLPFFKLVKKGLVLRLLGPERRLSMVDVDDVVTQCLLQADLPAAVGEAFFCASDESTTVEAMMRSIGEALHVTTHAVPVPDVVLRSLAAVADVVTNTTGRKLPLNKKLARQLLAPGWVCSTEKARRVLGFGPTWTIAQSLQRSADSYVAEGWL